MVTVRRAPALRLAVPLAAVLLAAAGCSGSGGGAAHEPALKDAQEIARTVEQAGAEAGGDPGAPDYQPPLDNAAMVKLISEKVGAQQSDAGDAKVLSSKSRTGAEGELGVVEAVLYTGGASGGWSYEDSDVTTCVRFRIASDGGPRKVSVKQIDCPDLPESSQ
jgi:hypothetical protein